MTKPPTADAVIAAIRARGSNATDLRDAAHEACHAIEFRAKKWSRDGVHDALVRGCGGQRHGASDMVRAEIVARAVEQVVCADFGVDCGTVETWAHICWFETMKNGITLPIDMLVPAITRTMTSRDVRRRADEIAALATKKPRKRSVTRSVPA